MTLDFFLLREKACNMFFLMGLAEVSNRSALLHGAASMLLPLFQDLLRRLIVRSFMVLWMLYAGNFTMG
jgi:hypothetical protein